MWQLTHPVGVDGGSEQRLGQGDIAQHRMQEEGRGGRVAAHDGVCNRILKHRATFWVKLVCGVRNRILQHSATFWVKLVWKCFGSRASRSIA